MPQVAEFRENSHETSHGFCHSLLKCFKTHYYYLNKQKYIRLNCSVCFYDVLFLKNELTEEIRRITSPGDTTDPILTPDSLQTGDLGELKKLSVQTKPITSLKCIR